jgi:single-strand DNA-binding protein
VNKISATGRVVADSELRYTPSGDAICNFRLASDVGFGDKKTTNWFNCQIWGKRGEAISPHISKGLPITVFGTLVMREWEKDGVKHLSPDIRVDEIELQGSKQSGDNSAPRQQRSRTSSPPMDDGGDIPFN